MRLLQLKDGNRFSLVERVGDNIPEYAILSHTWGADEDEVSRKEIEDGTGVNKAGFHKIRFCGEQAARDKIDYFWVDTCCIDQSSSADVQEAINSMFQWYHKAAKCYVYLSDVSVNENAEKKSFQESRWFTRGWTLQELIAARIVEFFTSEGSKIGDKHSMVHEIHDITRIPVDALQGSPLSQFSVEERRSWAANRQTKREEDAAYSLLGIFDVHMPLIYGEGRKKAFARLERKIKKSQDPLVLLSSRPSIESLRQDIGALTPQLTGGGPESMKRTEVPSFLGAYIDTLERAQGYVDFGALSRRATADFEKQKSKGKLNGLANGKENGLDDSWLKSHDFEAVLKEAEIFARHSANVDKHATGRLRKDSEVQDDLFDKPKLLRVQTNENKPAPAPKVSGNEEDETPERTGSTGGELELYQNAPHSPSGLSSPTHRMPRVWQKSTELESYAKDKQMQNRIDYARFRDVIQFLLDAKLKMRQESLKIVNDWLDMTKFNDRYNIAQYYDKQVSSRLEGTCEWVFSHTAYRAWTSDENANEARILWIYAPAGYGKTVLCAKLVEHLKSQQSLEVAFFFASPHAQSDGDPNFIIRYWISQIAQLDSNALDLIRGHVEAGQKASNSAIWALFRSIVSRNQYIFVLDGFDEYNRLEDARAEFLHKLKKNTRQTATRILMTSRDETDINSELSLKIDDGGHVILQCRITNADVRRDISHFSRSVVDKKLPNKDQTLRQDLAGQLADKCDGMFLWIKLQQDQLRGGKNAKQLQSIVKNMPVGLDKTYERNWKIIQSHPPEEKQRALAILAWTAFALRPLTVSEITEALLVELNDDDDNDDDDGPTILWDDLPDEIDDEYINSEIIDLCAALVEVRSETPGVGAGSRIIHLAHSSVREFLLSTILDPNGSSRKSPGSDQTSSQVKQQEHLAAVCLAYINSDDIWQEKEDNGGRECSFVQYAARHWNSHMNAAKGSDSKLIEQAKDFLRPDNKNFDHWRRHVEDSQTSCAATPLYFAAMFNLTDVMRHIWKEDPEQLDRIGGEYGTPLQAACWKGNEEALRLLLEWGANPNAKDGKLGLAVTAAILGGRKRTVEILVQAGLDLTLRDSTERTPLLAAASNGESDMVRWLIKAGADPEAKSKTGATCLNAAAKGGHTKIVQILLENGAAIEAADDENWTPLISAAHSNNMDTVKLLLSRGAKVAVTSTDGWTPLSSAANKDNLEIFKMLLERERKEENRCDLSTTNGNGWTLMNLAAVNGNIKMIQLLLDHGTDPKVLDAKGWTPLNAAASRGHIEAVRLLLDNGADVATANKEGWTPLNSAASKDHLEVVKLLLERGSDPLKATITGWTPLNSAASNGNLETVQLLLEKAVDVNAANNKNCTPINSAASYGNAEVVKALIDKGADINMANDSGWTPLHSAANKGHTEIARVLLERGADVGNKRWTPLVAASDKGHAELVKLLLKNGADMEVTDTNNWTALNAAACAGHVEIVRLLLDNGARINDMNNQNWTPVNSASCNGHIEAVRLLVERGADITIPNKGGWTPLNSAAGDGHPEVVKFLLEKGADASVPDNKGWTPLNAASSNGHVAVVKLLLESGRNPDLEITNTSGWTPLNASTSNGNNEVVKVLLEKGANTSAVNADGWTPLLLAANDGNLELVKLMIESGANPQIFDAGGWTPISLAVSKNHTDVVKYLLEKGVDTSTDGHIWSPLYLAANDGKLDFVKLLLEHGADVLSARHDGWTPLAAAASSGHFEVAKLLIDKGSDLTDTNGQGWTCLDVAASHDQPEIVKLLLEKEVYSTLQGVETNYGTIMNLIAYKGYTDLVQTCYDKYPSEVSLLDDHGRSPLLLAARGGQLKTVQQFIERGLDTCVLDTKGDGLLSYASSSGTLDVVTAILDKTIETSESKHWSPLHWACRAGALEVVQALIKHGYRGKSVKVAEPEGQWNPLAIAIYHGHEEMLAKLSPDERSHLGKDDDIPEVGRKAAELHGGYWCNSCVHDLYGPRFRCKKCPFLDYCFMCKPYLESLHANHGWEYFESHDENSDLK